MCDIEKQYYQYANIDYIKNKYGTEPMVQVSGKKKINNSEGSFWCGLLPLEIVDSSLKSYNWDSYVCSQGPEFIKEGDKIIYKSKYIQFNKCENIVNYREFYDIKQNYIELCEEFRLLNNLFYDNNTCKYISILSNGDCEDVALVENNTNMYISLKYLMKYASVKQMALALFFEFKNEISGTLEENQLEAFSQEGKREGNVFYGLWGDFINGDYPYSYSILRGKKIFLPRPVDTCGYWPYEKEREYCEYIIGCDEYGENKMYTSNPNKLKNYVCDNIDAPYYLTPVFFDKKVLHKYISNQDMYSVGEGYISCKSIWYMEIDNYHESYISAYLGDLGRDLPEKEQIHWKSYNILPPGKISKVAFCRDFLGIPVNPEILDLKFKYDFAQFQRKWSKKYSWMLFLPLDDSDKYNFDRLHIPLLNNQEEFDFLVLSLVKVLIDSLNNKELDNLIEIEDNKQSIEKLKKWFNTLNISDYEEHTNFLKNLQGLRSSSVGHRKGKNYKDFKKRFNLVDGNYKEVFTEILKKADNFILFLRDKFLQDSD